ncbi:hypothetical protein [Bacteroides reticulotermitis]|uniref:hypothetical protein n=1 Tax=Bacteroides reticulotermitis TaxID=1133319 RepID=UPI003A8C60A0
MKRTIIIAILSFIVGSLIFFFVGRATINTKTVYVKGETVNGSVEDRQLVPVKETTPDKPLLPTKEIEIQYRDTGSIVVQVVDTAAIIENYIKKRSYNLVAFDNKENGKLLLFPTVQYNELTGLDYQFTPVQREIYKVSTWQPFVSGSYSTLNYVSLGAGVFYHKVGFEYQYQIGFNHTNNGHSFGLKYKF